MTTPLLPGKILIVDDDADTRANLCDILELDDQPVETAGSIAEVLQRDNWSELSAIILDRKLPDGSAEDLLPRLRELAPDAAVLIVTGSSDLQGVIAALRQGAADYIIKPIAPEALRAGLLRIADRRRLALAKARSEAAFATLIEAAPSLVVILRPDNRVLYVNHFAEELTGHAASAVVGQDFLSTFLPAQWRPTHLRLQGEGVARCSGGGVSAPRRCWPGDLEGVLAGLPERSAESPVLCRDGSQRCVLWNARRLPDYEGGPAVLLIGQDITALKQAQERTLQAERLAAIGQMMTGLAHESGNALARGQACLEMLALEVQDRPGALELVGRAQKAQFHLQHLYEEVRNYAAPLNLDLEPTRLDSIWRQAWSNLALRREGRQTQLLEECAELDLRCAVDAFRLEQVFRKIFENALAACRDPVELIIRCSEASIEGRRAVLVSIRDNGPGLNAEQRARIFEPFFTTKTKGTGLGMAIALRIVEAHGGRIGLGAGPGAEILLTIPRGGS